MSDERESASTAVNVTRTMGRENAFEGLVFADFAAGVEDRVREICYSNIDAFMNEKGICLINETAKSDCHKRFGQLIEVFLVKLRNEMRAVFEGVQSDDVKKISTLGKDVEDFDARLKVVQEKELICLKLKEKLSMLGNESKPLQMMAESVEDSN